MIRPLRIHHRRVFAVLGLVLPVTFALGIAARKPAPVSRAQPDFLGAQQAQPARQLWRRDDLFTNAPVQVVLQGVDGRLAIACSATADFVKPDLLVYWSVRAVRPEDSLPLDSVLLGAFGTRSFALPEGAGWRAGCLVLFSLANQEVVAVSKPVHLSLSTE